MATEPTDHGPTPNTERPARPGETCSCGRPATIAYVHEDGPDVPYCGVPQTATAAEEGWDAILQAGAEQEDGRIADARAALTAASAAVMSGNLGYDAERVVERLTKVVEGLLALIAIRAERDAALEAAERKPFDDLARTVAEVEAERERGER
jgi:hypothetical protein